MAAERDDYADFSEPVREVFAGVRTVLGPLDAAAIRACTGTGDGPSVADKAEEPDRD